MEDAPKTGPGKKPQRKTPIKPGASGRRPAPTRRPAARPPVKPTVVPSDALGADDIATPEPESATVPLEQAPEGEAAVDEPAATPEAAAFTVPKLSVPTIMLGRAKAPVVEDTTVEVEAVEVEAVEPATVEPELAEPEPATPPVTKAVASKRRTSADTILRVESLTKRFDDKLAVNDVDLQIAAGSFYGIVGPNGAGKTTTLSMITGLLRPTEGTVIVHGSDVWTDPVVAKRNMGVLPDRLRLFDRLTGAQLLFYAGVLRGMDEATVRSRTSDLAHAFGLHESLSRLVSDYSAGMTKKVALAAAMIHSPRLLVLDEPFESVDPVSAATVTEILQKYVAAGGTVLLSSHSMDLVQRICDYVAVIVDGSVLADGTVAAVRNGRTLEERFVELAGGRETVEGLEWLHSFSD